MKSTEDTYIIWKGMFFTLRNNRELGTFYETLAAEYLEEQGLQILEKNYRCRSGEIDLIAKDKESLVFVEVKYRFSRASGCAAAAVNVKKQRMISKVAAHYLYTKVRSFEVPCRFDVVAFEGGKKLTWIQNAFEYCPYRRKEY